jgi:N-acetylglucosamine-6-phosphate deacetylase
MTRLYGHLYAPADLGLCAVTLEGDRIAAIDRRASAPAGSLGGPDCVIIPGLIDIQLNGGFGQDFSDPASELDLVCRELPRFGVSAFLPTVITSAPSVYASCLRNLRRREEPGRARALGVHLEGPYLSPRYAGTHDRAWIRDPDIAEARSWLAAGDVRMVTLAPERPGALELIRALVANGVVVSMGHSDADWEEADAAVRSGASLGTHLFNAMRPLHHREPGLPGYLLANHLPVSVVSDGVHLAPEMLRLVARVKCPDEFVLVTDALAGLGMPAGPFELAGRLIVSDGTVGRLSDGTLSGSVLPLPHALANLLHLGVEPAAAVQAATLNPARVLACGDWLGQVRVGGVADVVVLDGQWEVEATFIGGEPAYRRDS